MLLPPPSPTQALSLLTLLCLIATSTAQTLQPGNQTTLLSLPYPPSLILPLIQNYTNLTWNNLPPNSVLTNASSLTLETNGWKRGDARFYSLLGVNVTEVITSYFNKGVESGGLDEDGVFFEEVHELEKVRFPLRDFLAQGGGGTGALREGMRRRDDGGKDLTVMAGYDGMRWVGICEGRATMVNFTTGFVASDVGVAGDALGMLHRMDGEMVGRMLGGGTFQGCEALKGGRGGGGSSSSTTATTRMGAAMKTGVLSSGSFERKTSTVMKGGWVAGTLLSLLTGLVHE